MSADFRIAGLFAGIGGIEVGLGRALKKRAETVLLCESWNPARAVLATRFGDTEIHDDVRTLTSLPSDVNVLTAGFPCTDLSQAGRTAGIQGEASGLVAHVFDALRNLDRGQRIDWLIIENVPNMLALNRGQAMRYLVSELEDLGFSWAYRVVDTRFTGIPQRRRRVLLVASQTQDPRGVLFADDAGERHGSDLAEDAFGFYWTEGRRGLGWAQDAVPTLKGGSTLGIPSPPAVWLPKRTPGSAIVKPSIEDAEALQGFERGWTAVSEADSRRNGPRWKLVGNAVTVDVAAWLGGRLATPGSAAADEEIWTEGGAWPGAAWGGSGKVWRVRASEFPVHAPYRHLRSVMDRADLEPLSERATRGFWNRLSSSNLGRHAGFREAVVDHLSAVSG